MNYVYLIGKNETISPIIKRFKSFGSVDNNKPRRYKNNKGVVTYIYSDMFFAFDTESEAVEKLKQIYNETIEKEKEKLRRELENIDKNKLDFFKTITVSYGESEMAFDFEKELNNNGFSIVRKTENSYELCMLGNAVVFIIENSNKENLLKKLIKECKHHLKMIDIEDKTYFDDCDEEYLKNEWKNLVKKILKILTK